MKKLWLSYSWKDNVEGDVDFIAQQIALKDVEVKVDRYVLVAGRRLWPQIEEHIRNPEECDGWAIFLTKNSLSSEAVKEEIAYALDRALASRGEKFPLIGINPGDLDSATVPLAISTRLYVSLEDEKWAERIAAALHGQPVKTEGTEVLPVHFRVHTLDGRPVIEVRPRAGRWYPAFIAVPDSEFENIQSVMQAPAGHATLSGMVHSSEATLSGGNDEMVWKGYAIHHNVTPINSIYLWLKEPVSYIIAGDVDGPKYVFRPKL